MDQACYSKGSSRFDVILLSLFVYFFFVLWGFPPKQFSPLSVSSTVSLFFFPGCVIPLCLKLKIFMASVDFCVVWDGHQISFFFRRILILQCLLLVAPRWLSLLKCTTYLGELLFFLCCSFCVYVRRYSSDYRSFELCFKEVDSDILVFSLKLL